MDAQHEKCPHCGWTPAEQDKLSQDRADLLAALRLLRGWLINDEDTLDHLHDAIVSRETRRSMHDEAVLILTETAERAIARAESLPPLGNGPLRPDQEAQP